MGCKVVGTVKGTKLWAGECIAAPELRTATPPEDKAPTPSPENWPIAADLVRLHAASVAEAPDQLIAVLMPTPNCAAA